MKLFIKEHEKFHLQKQLLGQCSSVSCRQSKCGASLTQFVTGEREVMRGEGKKAETAGQAHKVYWCQNILPCKNQHISFKVRLYNLQYNIYVFRKG
jgi:hypothetical protein